MGRFRDFSAVAVGRDFTPVAFCSLGLIEIFPVVADGQDKLIGDQFFIDGRLYNEVEQLIKK